MRNLIYKVTPLILLLAGLTGCTGMNGHFGCNAMAADGCTPVSEVNLAAEHGLFAKKPSSSAQFNPLQPAMGMVPRGAKYQRHNTGEPLRYGERVEQIWIAPFQDKQKNYHQAGSVYTVLEKSHWHTPPVNEIKNNESS